MRPARTILIMQLSNSREEMGPTTKKLYETLTGIQMGRIEAPEGWIKVIE